MTNATAVEVKTDQNARYSSVAEWTEDFNSALSVKTSCGELETAAEVDPGWLKDQAKLPVKKSF